MRIVRNIVLGLLGLIVVAVIGLAAYLLVSPPEVLRVAGGYTAKIVCSNHFLAGRDPAKVLADDVQAPGHPILRFVGVAIDDAAGTVTAKFFGLFAPSIALYRPGLGCSSVPDGNLASAKAVKLASLPVIAPPSAATWPEGGTVSVQPDAALAAILADKALTGPGMRAVAVVKNGRIVGEAYGPEFDEKTPLLGWSMTKTLNAALIGRLMNDGKIGFSDANLFSQWTGDGRNAISLANLLGMQSGLGFNEDYGDVSDVNRMLFLEPDMAKFAAAQPVVAAPGTLFNYSSGTGVMLSRIWMDKLGDAQAALSYPRAALFDPLGMTSAVMEADEAGTFVGSSYTYATARDWARLGLFLLDDGVWQGQRLLPEGFVRMMATSNGEAGSYSQAQSWVYGPDGDGDPALAGLPAGTFWLEGHDGQSIAVMPASGLVIVRLGLTPSKDNYAVGNLAKAIVAALG